MTKTKYSFFEQIYMAVAKPMQYFRLTKISGGRLTIFIFLFALITNLFTTIPYIYDTVGPNGLTSYLRDKLPAFELSDGVLHMDQRFENDDGSIHILIDTNVDKYTKDDVNDQYVQDFLISKHNIIVYQLGSTQEINLQLFGKFHFNNKLLTQVIYISIFFSVILIYLMDVASLCISALLFSLIGLITAFATKMNLKYGRIFKTAIYSNVPVSIVSILYSIIVLVTPLRIPGLTFFGITILINCAYVVYGTLSHNSDDANENTETNIPPQNYFSGM